MKTIHTCRAKSKRTGHWIYGYLVELWTPKGEEQRYAIDQCTEYDFDGNSTSVEEIDIHTLEYPCVDVLLMFLCGEVDSVSNNFATLISFHRSDLLCLSTVNKLSEKEIKKKKFYSQYCQKQ